ncbi:MAG: hypothetical protein RIC19_10660 [Phaeodactylibacter sp.]|uniref:hypothetical protein n=1 Tax=Phaeodactylibacter sp. TaxID=1940289 RepID=UPI0032EE70C9
MNKTLIYPLAMITALLLGPVSNYAQDIFDGLFEKEQPRFFAQIQPTMVPGEAQLIFHFTHSKASEVEASVWITDLGANLQDPESKEMVSGLRTLGNRKRDTILLTGLTNRHFYNVGVDYRVKSPLPRKFESTLVREQFRYEGTPGQPVAQQQPPTPAAPNRDWQARAAIPAPQTAAPDRQPCQEPQLNLRIDPAGYCDRLNRPAVIVSCSNCQGTTWDFLVEVKANDGKWFPTRADGRPQAALGMAPRTEPLCLIPNNTYELRVLAWGENCALPVVKELGTTIQVGPRNVQQPTVQPYAQSSPSPYRTQPAAPVNAPEVCGVSGTATLIGSTVRGSLQLPGNSDCTALNPYAEIAYIHPGYRDINMGKVSLYPGLDMPFELDLDQRDMQRGIHTLRVTIYMPLPDLPRPVAAETFWIRAEEQTGATADRGAVIPDLENRLQQRPGAYEPQPDAYSQSADTPMRGTIGTQGIERTNDDLYIDQALLEEQANTISVTATDPNCTPIQDLQLVYSPTQPDRPLYLSWLSPRCCQEQGCKYTVWAGPSPDKLSLVVNGQKAGAQVSEILNNLPARHNYFEVAVETTNGARKAAYVPGSGPIYGIEAVLDYHDQFKPQKSDPVQGRMSSDTQEKGANGDLSNRMQVPARPVAMESNPLQPKMPIAKFRPCKYQRETTVNADYPIQTGETVTIDYAFTEPDHQFTLYHQPFGSAEWQLAPGTTELQSKPSFELQATDYHAGKYLVLVYKDSKNWGCLSAPLSDPIELNVMR